MCDEIVRRRRCVRGGRVTASSILTSRCSSSTGRESLPPRAIVIAPVCSETTSTTASVCSVKSERRAMARAQAGRSPATAPRAAEDSPPPRCAPRGR